MTRDWRSQRAQRDAKARSNAQRQGDFRKTLHRHFQTIYRHDMADPVGYSAIWETSSANRHGTMNAATSWDPIKPPGTGD